MTKFTKTLRYGHFGPLNWTSSHLLLPRLPVQKLGGTAQPIAVSTALLFPLPAARAESGDPIPDVFKQPPHAAVRWPWPWPQPVSFTFASASCASQQQPAGQTETSGTPLLLHAPAGHHW